MIWLRLTSFGHTLQVKQKCINPLSIYLAPHGPQTSSLCVHTSGWSVGHQWSLHWPRWLEAVNPHLAEAAGLEIASAWFEGLSVCPQPPLQLASLVRSVYFFYLKQKKLESSTWIQTVVPENVTGQGGKLAGTRRIQGFSRVIYVKFKPVSKITAAIK